jgi:hypothetical protein
MPTWLATWNCTVDRGVEPFVKVSALADEIA